MKNTKNTVIARKPSEKTHEKILVLCIDRDDDLGEKAGIRGPLIGKEEVLKASTAFGLADPEDSDFNTMFQAVKVFEETKKLYTAQVAVITGDKDVGIKSDMEIARQLDVILTKFPANYVVLVTDGAEDEHVIPIIQSKVPILSVKRLIVKQAAELESTYYKIKDFIEESLENPKFSGLVFGLPAIALLLFAVFGAEGGRFILGIFGVYLLIKGFKLESYFMSLVGELRDALVNRKFAFFMYMVSIVLFAVATYRGYSVIGEWINIGIFETIAAFTSASVYFYFLFLATAWFGSNVGQKIRSRRKIIAAPLFGFSISVIVYNAAEFILKPSLSNINFMLSIIFGFSLLFVALFLEWKG